jgi:uncharacterized coiled-coil protein SlyX
MSSFLKKALERPQSAPDAAGTLTAALNEAELEKLGKHFDKVFEKVNKPGADYFEYCKMMESLEAHIPDEKSRMAAVYDFLKTQGLQKEKVAESAEQYKQVILTDREVFKKAVSAKTAADIDSRKNEMNALETKVAENNATIARLQQQNAEARVTLEKLKKESAESESKIRKSTNNYAVASEAILNKINYDIQKINSST